MRPRRDPAADRLGVSFLGTGLEDAYKGFNLVVLLYLSTTPSLPHRK